jgi:hypothetical protein
MNIPDETVSLYQYWHLHFYVLLLSVIDNHKSAQNAKR